MMPLRDFIEEEESTRGSMLAALRGSTVKFAASNAPDELALFMTDGYAVVIEARGDAINVHGVSQEDAEEMLTSIRANLAAELAAVNEPGVSS